MAIKAGQLLAERLFGGSRVQMDYDLVKTHAIRLHVILYVCCYFYAPFETEGTCCLPPVKWHVCKPSAPFNNSFERSLFIFTVSIVQC